MSRPRQLHLDEARNKLMKSLHDSWSALSLKKVLVIEDAFGRFSLGLWGNKKNESILEKLLNNIAPYGASLFWAQKKEGGFDPLELEVSWSEAMPISLPDGVEDPNIRTVVRHRMLPAWLQCRKEPLWPLAGTTKVCPIVSFYSFKGGMGRTTNLAAFAIDRARQEEHVVVVDLDLDAPGLGSILSTTDTIPYGVVDYLLETPVLGQCPEDLLDYSWLVNLGAIPTTGSLRVFPAGRLDSNYLGKMARLDFNQLGDSLFQHPLEKLVLQIRETYDPDWILLDSRTGFSETAGMLLSGLAHFHVLVGVDSVQSWEGLAYAVRKLGAERVQRGFPQAETMIVHGMVPELNKSARTELLERFSEHSEDLFAKDYYLAPEENRDEAYWYLGDSSGEDAPHRPWPISYRPAIAQSAGWNDIIDALDSNESGFASFCATAVKRARPEGF